MFGRPIYAQLDEAMLKRIAQETNGLYFKSINNTTLEQINQRILQNITNQSYASIRNILLWVEFAVIIALLFYLSRVPILF
jgi:Ca-activated chloride channel family protein